MSTEHRAPAPPSRALHLPLIALGAGTTAYAIVLSQADSLVARFAVQSIAFVGTNAWAISSFLSRAKAQPEERGSWRQFALGSACGVAGSTAGIVLGLLSATSHALETFSFLAVLIGSVLQAHAALRWTQNRLGTMEQWFHALGGLVFMSSLAIILWLSVTWTSGFSLTEGGAALARWGQLKLAVINTGSRTVLVGGATIFLLSEDPRRLKGPLGLILAGVGVMVAASLGILYSVSHGYSEATRSAWFGLGQAAPVLYGLAAWSRLPTHPASDAKSRPVTLLIALQYLPFIASGVLLTEVDLRDRSELGLALGAFLVISLVSIGRKVLLVHAVERMNETLEARVRERTRELEQLQAVALRTERLNSLATLGAGLTHDLNNLHAVIGMSAELMQAELKNSGSGHASHAAHVGEIRLAIQRAGRLTKRLMSFAREELGGAEPTIVDLSAAVASQEELLRIVLPRNIKLVMQLDAPRRYVLVPPTLVEQVLVNLVANSRDVMPLGGEIRIAVRSPEPAASDHLLLEVEDTGPGIPPEIQDAIFEPFFSTKGEKGTGIGLASVRTLMQSIGGSATVSSTPGVGATFTLRFPLYSDAAEETTNAACLLPSSLRELGQRVGGKSLQAAGSKG